MQTAIEKYNKIYEGFWREERQIDVLKGSRKDIAFGMCPSTEIKAFEIGCGRGDLLDRLFKKYRDVIGIDISNYALTKLKKMFNYLNIMHADARRLPFREKSFDLVVAIDILEHIEDEEVAFIDWLRILKPRGMMILSVPFNKKLWNNDDNEAGHFRRYDFLDIQKLMKNYNCSLAELRYLGFPFYRITRWFLNLIQKKRENKISTGCFAKGIATRSRLKLLVIEWMLQVELIFSRLPLGVFIVLKVIKRDIS